MLEPDGQNYGTIQYVEENSGMRSDLINDTIYSLTCSNQNHENHDIRCFEYKPSDEVLTATKQAVVT